MMSTRRERLEGTSIRLLWEAVAEAKRPILVEAADRASAALVRVARRAFFPAAPPFPIVSPHDLAVALAQGDGKVDLVLQAATDAAAGGEDAALPIWGLGGGPKRRGETTRLSPLAGWSDTDVQRYLQGGNDGSVSMWVGAAGTSGAGKTTLLALLGTAPRHPGSARLSLVDVAGHDRDPRGVLTAASNADLTLVVLDGRQGLSTTARRDLVLLSELGVPRVVVAVNKIDLTADAPGAFARVADQVRQFSTGLKLPSLTCVPVSATRGDNVLAPAATLPWYDGPTLLGLLDAAQVESARPDTRPLRLSVQWAFLAGAGFSGFAGTIASGSLRTGDAVRIQPSGRITRVARIATPDGDLSEAAAGQSVAVALEDAAPLARGDLIVPADAPAEISDQFEATIVWMNPAPLLRGRGYLVKVGARMATATIAPLKHKIDVNTLGHLAGATLGMNEIGVCNVHLDRDVPFDPYAANHDTGGFIVIDRLSNETVGAGMLHFALRRAQNVHWQALEVNKIARAALKQQRACVLWYTGLSGAGKSTIANLVDKKLHSLQRHTYLLDGDNVRHGLNKDLGFTDVDRVENIRRIGEVSKLMVDAGLIVSTAFISPFRAERMMARALLADGEFFEIFIDTPLGVAEQRDPKGLYKKARRGDLKNFTGIDSPYEAPASPELRISTTEASPEEAAEAIVAFLLARGVLS
jgi:bifunctional enzyme CysN/CysC